MSLNDMVGYIDQVKRRVCTMNETTSFIPEIYIGEKWNWYINGYDTGIRARGVSDSSG